MIIIMSLCFCFALKLHLHSIYLPVSPLQKVVWYFVCDNMEVRRAAKQYFGDKLLTTLEGLTLTHIAPQSHGGGAQAFASSVGENWLFGMTDVQVGWWYARIDRCAAGQPAGWRGPTCHRATC
jgi:hypothetical protein